VELAVALARMTREEAALGDGGAAEPGDAGAPGAAWPGRCAPFAEALSRHLDEAGDASLDALRDALPTPARFSLPYALLPEEAAELGAAIERAGLPPRPADNEPAPAPLAAPLSTAGVAPLGKGRLGLDGDTARNHATDLLSTRALHLLVRDARARLCALAPEGPAGPFGAARCGDLPAWLDTSSAALPLLDDDAPLAVHASKSIPPTPEGRTTASGILVLGPGPKRAIPIQVGYSWRSYQVFIADDGSYIIPAYSPLVRLGKIADRAVSGTSPATEHAVAAYGMVFFNDRRPFYKDFDPERRFWGRRMDPVFDPVLTDLGPATANDLTTLDGCRQGDRRAVLFATYEKKKARVVLVDGSGTLRGIVADTGTTAPHLHCGGDAVFVTSVEPADRHGSVVVVETRCAGASCEAKRSAPIALPAAAQVDAATFDGGVVLSWVTRPDEVGPAARGMAFYKVGALEQLPAAAPRPLFEGARRGGFDVARAHLVPRPKAVVVALETRGKAPVTYAARIDASGAATAVRVEETSW
jgi:hypothetical protein